MSTARGPSSISPVYKSPQKLMAEIALAYNICTHLSCTSSSSEQQSIIIICLAENHWCAFDPRVCGACLLQSSRPNKHRYNNVVIWGGSGLIFHPLITPSIHWSSVKTAHCTLCPLRCHRTSRWTHSRSYTSIASFDSLHHHLSG